MRSQLQRIFALVVAQQNPFNNDFESNILTNEYQKYVVVQQKFFIFIKIAFIGSKLVKVNKRINTIFYKP
jgi:hypothetical protein